MKIIKKNVGGYLTQLEASRPELFKTIKSYRDRLTTPEQKTFDQRANIQLAASRNMPERQRQAYYSSIEKEYGQATDKQFQQLREGLKSKTFTPTYSFYTPPEQSQQQGKTAATTGYYRDLSKEMADLEKQMQGLTFSETKTRKVPVYSYYEGRSGVQGLPGSQPGVARTTTELPKGSTFSPGRQSGYITTPAGYVSPKGVRYTQQGTRNITETFTRPQRAGDPEYDKMARQLGTLQTRHKYRFGFGDETPKTTSQDIYASFGPTSFKNPYETLATKRVKKGGEIKGQGKAIRGFKFGGIK